MKIAMHSLLIFLVLLTAFACDGPGNPDLLIDGNCKTVAPSGYAAVGDADYTTVEVENPNWPNNPITVFLQPRRAPVIFFSHGFTGNVWEAHYPDLMQYIASRGYVVVFVPYQTAGSSTNRYVTLWTGFQAAVDAYGYKMDLTRIGFVGHSFGGGATPRMAYHGFVEEGWGRNGRFMFMMAPWYSLEISDSDLAAYPANTYLIVQTYDDDTVNDFRMAIDIFQHVTIPMDRKNYFFTQSDSKDDCLLDAYHGVPSQSDVLHLKHHAVYRLLGALSDYVFTGNLEARQIAMGNGTEVSVDMGRWYDGDSVKPLVWSDNPSTNVDQSTFEFPWDSTLNPRR